MNEATRKRILIVEDHAALLGLIVKTLQLEGFEVAAARNVRDAMMHLAETIPDLIVSDIMMPGGDGFALARHVRLNARTDLIPIIFLTARDGREDFIKGLRAGVDAYLTKPFEPEELLASIVNILDRVRRTHRRVASIAAADNLNETATTAREIPPDSELTETETKVAEAVSRGLSNKEIAREFGTSYRTVEMHVSHILAKKNLSNRVELARHVIEREQMAKEATALE